ncbi:MAG: transcription antitermination factor NusB [Acidaminococcaceae bacterium]|jgi:N utilization substance protein B|nr:transcription antitermination factor NusB [Acidaminococcaceae bacterium]MBO5603777.1 transcription antitermination factor NusB [Acidaminococcaceae bacterium]MBO6182098.1 transcription antitermination factor NusB [Acidaminococcaceae bacterium]MBO6264587.1 transcription antitermination factor NusB [Acidaminococcaceae bacterium]MBP3264441.1 transcription antitermination factor NusB [Acidaminococcaceae bacterium]
MIRRVAREMVLQSLFQMDFTQADPEESLKIALEVQRDEEKSEEAEKAFGYAEKVLKGVSENLSEIDGLIGKYAINWEVKRMPGIDRNILRMAIYEMRFAKEKLPVTVAVNEAVELAKTFGTEKSSRFINGVLGKLMREEK